MILMLSLISGFKWYASLLVNKLPSGTVRVCFSRLLGVTVGSKSRICYGVELRGTRNIVIGSNVVVGTSSIVDGRGGVTIGNNVNISSQVMIWSSKHDHSSNDFGTVLAKVQIEDQCWLGPRSIIMPGVKIGAGAIVCGGAVVTKDVPSLSIVAGVPAAVIGKRKNATDYALETAFHVF